MTATTVSTSLRRRLLIQLLGVALLLSVGLYLSMRAVADKAVEVSQDNVLGASVASIAEQISTFRDEVVVDIPHAAFAMLGNISEDRVYYRVVANGATVTGYADLPLPQIAPDRAGPVFYSVQYRGAPVRIAAIERTIPVAETPVPVLALVAQTMTGREATSDRAATMAAGLGIGMLLVAGVLSWVAVRSALQPLVRVAAAVEQRGPHDLHSLQQPVPKELHSLVNALNRFMTRLQAAMNRTETLVAEAAHHIRTPLTTVRTQAEIALRRAEGDANRRSLLSVIRAVDESSRSASQLLDHAIVTFRSDHLETALVDVAALSREVVRAMSPTAEMKDLSIGVELPNEAANVQGDRVLIEHALRNLLDNAVKYSSAESEVLVRVSIEPEVVVVAFIDAGRGIESATATELGQRFRRGDNVDDVVGSGLGLTIVEEVARVHGGAFDMHGNRGEGVCATLSLPRVSG